MGREARENRAAERAKAHDYQKARRPGALTPMQRDELRAMRKKHQEASLSRQSGIIVATEMHQRELEKYGRRGPDEASRETVTLNQRVATHLREE